MARAMRKMLPEHDFLYLGDSLHVPYGPRSGEAIYSFTKRAMDYLFAQECKLVIVACNTASASALRRLQQEYLPAHFPDRRILGVIVPTVEAALDTQHKRLGVLATAFTVQSGVYKDELRKIDPAIELFAMAAPLLVPLIEADALHHARPVLQEYLQPLLDKNIDALILGCTHYPLLKPLLAEMLPAGVDIISQDELVPPKLVDYLRRRPEIDARLSKQGRFTAALTDVTPTYAAVGENLFGQRLHFEKVIL